MSDKRTGWFVISREFWSDKSARLNIFNQIRVTEFYPSEKYKGCIVVEGESEHFDSGYGLYSIIMKREEGMEPYILRAEFIEEESNAVQ